MPTVLPRRALSVACREAVRRAVPAHARRLLLVGHDEDLARELRAARPDADLHTESDPGANGFDVVIEPARDSAPESAVVLAAHRRRLRPGGQLLILCENPAHHGRLTAVLRGHEPAPAWPLARWLRQLLDAGFAPDLAAAIPDPGPVEMPAALARTLGLHPQRLVFFLHHAHFLLRAVPEPEPPVGDVLPLTFVACVSDEAVLAANLTASPVLAGDHPHQVLLYHDCPSAAEGLHRGRAEAHHEIVVLVHQDVYLPAGWDRRFAQQSSLARRLFGRVGLAGVYGAARRGQVLARAGRVVDRSRLLSEPAPLPATVDAPDELLLALPRDSPLQPDAGLGFHLYGADLGQQARAQGQAVVVLDALALHDSATVGLSEAFRHSAARLARKWPRALPLATACGWIGTPAAPTIPESSA